MMRVPIYPENPTINNLELACTSLPLALCAWLFQGLMHVFGCIATRGQQFIASWGIINTNGLILPGNIAGETRFGGQVH